MNTKTQTYSLEYVKAYGEEMINKYNAFVEDNKNLKCDTTFEEECGTQMLRAFLTIEEFEKTGKPSKCTKNHKWNCENNVWEKTDDDLERWFVDVVESNQIVTDCNICFNGKMMESMY